MNSTFNPQILMGKLAKLNSSQQSIETLSHWCIFHMNKAKNVVETWDRQFHSSPREQRLAFLYLANDILQNSRRKGSEFVGEFWKVLPNALRDVIGNGDEFGRNAALRLINIWEERKVFGSRGQLLKEELVGRNLETSTRNENHPPGFKLRNSAGNGLDKVISAYQIVYGDQLDEDTVLSKCKNAIFCIEKVGKEIDGDRRSEQLDGSGIVEEIKGQHAILLGCIEQLTVMESSRANLVSHLREALREQEFRLNHVRYQLQAAQSQSEQASNLCRQFQNSVQLLPEQSMKKTRTSKVPKSFMAGSGEQTAPVMYTRQVPCAVKPEPLEEDFKSGAAAAAAQLTSSTSSTSSGQMPTYILSSLTTEGVIVSATKESSNDYPPEKKPKLENNHSVYIPSQNPQPPVPPFPHPDSLKPSVLITSKEIIPEEQPPLPTSPPPMPPLPTSPPPMHPYPVPQFMQNAGSIPSVPYGYATTQQQPQPFPYPTVGTQFTGIPPFPAPPTNAYQSYQTEGGFYGQQPSFSTAPISRQL